MNKEQNENYAMQFLLEKFGQDRANGNGLAKLLEEYRVWFNKTIQNDTKV